MWQGLTHLDQERHLLVSSWVLLQLHWLPAVNSTNIPFHYVIICISYFRKSQTFTSIMSSYVSVISENHIHFHYVTICISYFRKSQTFTSIMSSYVSVISENHKHSLPWCHHMYQLFQKITTTLIYWLHNTVMPTTFHALNKWHKLNPNKVSFSLSFFIIFNLYLLFKCHFVAWQRGFPKKCAVCVSMSK